MNRVTTMALLAVAAPTFAHALTFTTGDLVVSVEGNGVYGAASGPYTDNQAAPLTLFEFTTSGAYQGSMVLPQIGLGGNSAISGEYGSSSEGALQLTGDGHALTIMGYGVNAATYNANVAKNANAYGGMTTDPAKATALGQSSSIQSANYTAVPRVVAVIGANGSVNTSTAVYGVFNGNNPRSVYSPDRKTFYISGQGNSPDQTGGVFYTTLGSHSATSVTGLDASSTASSGNNITQETRYVTAYNGQLYVSTDTKEGKNSAKDFVGALGAVGSAPGGLVASTGPGELSGFGNSGGTGKVTITKTKNGVVSNGNGLNAGAAINLSPEAFFFANATTLYVADSGAPKNDSNASNGVDLGDGGLQKWSLVGNAWVLDYTLSNGLNLVTNSTTGTKSGTTGLLGLTGKVVGDEVELFATNYTIGDTDPTFLYGITDVLGDTVNPGNESFVQLAAAPVDSNFKGVSFAPTPTPVPEPGAYALLVTAFGGLGALLRRRREQLRGLVAGA